MKFKVSSTELSARLQTVGKVIQTKNKIQCFDSFLFEIQGLALTITASDGENTIRTSLDLIESSEDGRFIVNSTIQDALKWLPEQPITVDINTASYETKIIYQNGFYSLVCQPITDNPYFTELEKETGKLKVSATILYESVTRALLAVSTDPIRPVMCGVLFDVAEENTTIVASDGRKLVYTRWSNAEKKEAASIIMPQKAAQLLKGILARENGDVAIRFDDKRTEIQMETYFMSCRLIDGRFPNYNSVIPDNQNCATLNRAALASAMQRVMAFSNEAMPTVKLHFEPDKLTASVQNIDYSLSAEETLLCEYDGIPLSIGLHGATLSDLLNNIQCEEAVLRMADQSKPVIIVPAQQPEGQDIIMLTMPIMIKE